MAEEKSLPDSSAVARLLPDVHFDWYARLMPGLAAFIFYFISRPTFNLNDSINSGRFDFGRIFVTAVICYVAGNLIQPISTVIAKTIDTRWCGYKDNKGKYNEFKSKAKTESHMRSITNISKCHAECVGMISTFFLFIAVCLLNFRIDFRNPTLNTVCLLIASIFLIGSAIERSFARQKKIQDLGKIGR